MQGNRTKAAGDQTGGEANQIQQAYQAASASQPAAQPQPQAQQQAPVGGLRGLMMRGRAPMSKDNNGRALSELVKKLTDYRDENQSGDLKDLDLRIIPMARNSELSAQGFSNQIGVIIFALGYDNRFAYHSLLLEAEMPPAPPARIEQYGYGIDTTPAPRTAVQLADEALAIVIKQKVSKMLPQSQLTSADWSTVPEDFKVNDPFAIEDLFLNALRACWEELQSKEPDFKYDSLAGSAGDNTALVSIHFNQDQSHNAQVHTDKVGLPIRSEIVIDFRSEQPRSTARELQTENTANVVEFGQSYAYVTLGIDPVAARQNQWGGPQTGANDTQEYVGEVTISGIDLVGKVDLANVLLMISTALPVLDSQTRPWLRNFLPRHLQHNGAGGGNLRPRDLGALNWDYRYVAQAGAPVEPFNTLDENAFTIERFNWLTSSLIQAGAALSIDVPECGDSTWFLRPFAEANDVPQAYEAIVKAADGLTDGRFSQIFNQTSRIITLPRTERVLNGYYLSDNGSKRDIREIDMLYLLNRLGHEDPEIGKAWMATFGGGTEQQLAARAKLIERVVSNVRYTGVSIHKTFHPDFLVSLDRAISGTGLKIRNEMSREDSRLMHRPVAGLASAGALMTNFSSGLYVQNGGYQNPGAAYRGMAHTRRY